MKRSTGQLKQEHDRRFRVSITVSDHPGGSRTITNYVVNMSTGGMFIESLEILPVDTLLEVELLLPGSSLRWKARVAWTNGPNLLKKQSLPYGMGLQFLTPLTG